MSSLHPLWQSTEDESPVPVRVRTSDGPQTVSRLPGAVAGILSVLGIGAFVFGGWQALGGQVTPPTPDVTIHLTADGADPASINVQAGNTIRWINDDQIPHILSSETLPTADDEPFLSSAIFPESDFFYVIPVDATDGTYPYVSETAETLTGEIVIGLAVSSISSAAASSAPVIVAPLSSAPAVSSIPAFPTPASAPTLPAQVIEPNPHVVGARSSTSTKPGVTQHKPTKNTESGPALWIVGGLSMAALAVVTRKAFRSL